MLGSIIGGVSSILGGLFGQKSQDKQMAAQMAAQKEFAQQGIRWRVADAKAAGIHPLYALGANTASFSPIGIGGSPLAEGLSQAGQEIGRAVQAKGTSAERAFNAKMMALQVQRGELENAVLASQLARQNAPSQLPPPMPLAVSGGDGNMIPGQPATAPAVAPERWGGAGGSKIQAAPLQRIVDPSGTQEPGSVADRSYSKVGPGEYRVAPSADLNERMEDQIVPSLAWALDNYLLPNLGGAKWGRPPFSAPAGYEWRWTPQQTYKLKPKSGKGDRIKKLPY